MMMTVTESVASHLVMFCGTCYLLISLLWCPRVGGIKSI